VTGGDERVGKGVGKPLVCRGGGSACSGARGRGKGGKNPSVGGSETPVNREGKKKSGAELLDSLQVFQVEVTPRKRSGEKWKKNKIFKSGGDEEGKGGKSERGRWKRSLGMNALLQNSTERAWIGMWREKRAPPPWRTEESGGPYHRGKNRPPIQSGERRYRPGTDPG